MLEIQNWTVKYPDGTEAVRDLSFTASEGEHLALVGANGAGKSTLILSIVGIVPGQGRVAVEGVVLGTGTVNEIRSKAGVVFQNPDDQLFLPTIYDDIAFGPRNQGLDEKAVRYRVEDRLRMLHIEHLRDRSAMKLSGGEKRLAALATVLAMKPSVLLLDEPTAFLDPRARRNLINILKTLPHTMLIATHDLPFAEEVCPRSIIMKKGTLFADGPSGDLLYDREKMEEAEVEAIGVYSPAINRNTADNNVADNKSNY
ncbi:MAG: ABC transporter ATP-binding protein [Eubacteriales bacterium]|nr:ABC transporter ATP-binding protein [Eubacteriales bacterium]